MKVAVLCGYRDFTHDLKATADALDAHIENIQNLGHIPICVLANQNADELLRLSRRLAAAELVLDTNEPANLWTNTKGGLATLEDEGCAVVPVEFAPPTSEVLGLLMHAWQTEGFATPYEILQLTDRLGAPFRGGFPLIITRRGIRTIRSIKDSQGLTDSRLKYLQVPCTLDSTLADVRAAP